MTIKRVAPAASGLIPPSPSPTELARTLSAQTDELTEKLKKAQQRLIGLGLGVSASINITTEFETSVSNEVFLIFRKEGPDWQLFVEHGIKDAYERTTTPLLRASKNYRIRAAGKMGDMLNALMAAAERQVREMRAAIGQLDELLEKTHDVIEGHGAAVTPANVSEDDDIPF